MTAARKISSTPARARRTARRSPRGQRRASRVQRRPIAVGAIRIAQEAVRDDVDLVRLSEMAAADPGFALRVLSVANSAAVGLRQNVRDIHHAIALLGARGLRNIALGIALTDLVPRSGRPAELVALALRRGCAARMLAEALCDPSPDEHFTTGLFLEIGLLSRIAHTPDEVGRVAASPQEHRPTIEASMGWSPHPEHGGAMAREYGLGEEMVRAVEWHHAACCPEGRLPRVAWAAERIAGAFEAHGDVDRGVKRALKAGAELGLGRKRVLDLLDALPAKVAEASRAFDCRGAKPRSLDEMRAKANERLAAMTEQYELLVRSLESVAHDLREANEKLERLADTDGLTGLANRRAFETALASALSGSGDDRVGVVLLDLDRFKQINDSHGHLAGDDVLRATADAVRGALREGDVAARYGGEELVVLLTDLDREEAENVAERMRAAVEKVTVEAAGATIRVTTSCGVAAFQGRAEHPDDASSKLLAAADAALYEAKAGGRNRVCVAPPV